jgi:hypothetical protein
MSINTQVHSLSRLLEIDRAATRGEADAIEMLHQLNIPLRCPECLQRHWPGQAATHGRLFDAVDMDTKEN